MISLVVPTIASALMVMLLLCRARPATAQTRRRGRSGSVR